MGEQKPGTWRDRGNTSDDTKGWFGAILVLSILWLIFD